MSHKSGDHAVYKVFLPLGMAKAAFTDNAVLRSQSLSLPGYHSFLGVLSKGRNSWAVNLVATRVILKVMSSGKAEEKINSKSLFTRFYNQLTKMFAFMLVEVSFLCRLIVTSNTGKHTCLINTVVRWVILK